MWEWGDCGCGSVARALACKRARSPPPPVKSPAPHIPGVVDEAHAYNLSPQEVEAGGALSIISGYTVTVKLTWMLDDITCLKERGREGGSTESRHRTL